MSSFIDVGVSFCGVALVLVNCAVFIRMVLSFPAMMNSPGSRRPPALKTRRILAPQHRRSHHYQPEPAHSDYAVSDTEGPAIREPEPRYGIRQTPTTQAIDCSSVARPTGRKTIAMRRLEPARGRPLTRGRRQKAAQRMIKQWNDEGYASDSDYEEKISCGKVSRGNARHCIRELSMGMKVTQ